MPARSQATSAIDRKSTRLNSSHQIISYAVFSLKKKKYISTRCVRTSERHSSLQHPRLAISDLAKEKPDGNLSSICKTNNSFFFFFNDTATTEIYTLSLHDALPI